MNDAAAAVIALVANTLEIPAARVGPDASMATLAEWDSLAQLKICMRFQERYDHVMDMTAIAEATSVAALSKLLQAIRSGK
jgi:acyl carrier protein